MPLESFGNNGLKKHPNPTGEGGIGLNENFEATDTALDLRLEAANNLSDLASASTARSNLGSHDASNLITGTLPDARFPATLPAVSGANLTNLPAGNLTGSIADARLSSNVPLKDAANTFTQTNTFATISATAIESGASNFIISCTNTNGDLRLRPGTATGGLLVLNDNDSSGTGVHTGVYAATGTSTKTSGNYRGMSITPTYNQASGTCANTDLFIQRTQTAVGSGNQFLIEGLVGVSTVFSVSNTGVIVGVGSGLTALNASNISTGTLSTSRLPTGIDAANLADGSVSNTEFQYLANVTSDIQTQFSNKQPLDSDLTALAALTTTSFGRGILEVANAGAARTYIGAGTGNGDALTTNPLSQFASTTSSQLAGVISDETGSGALVFGTTPTFTTNITVPLVISASTLTLRPAAGSAVVINDNNITASGTFVGVSVSTGSVGKTSGNYYGLSISPTYNQTGTCNNSDLRISRTETALGSGTQRFIECAVGGIARFQVQRATNTVIVGTPAATSDTITPWTFNLTGGNGANGDGSLGVDVSGTNGSTINITAGSGGNGDSGDGGPTDGGDAGHISITGGNGGVEEGGGTDGDGGYISIQAGTRGGITATQGYVVINDAGSATDFRVESDTQTHMIYVDATNNKVGIANSSPTTALDVTGTVTATLFSGSGASLTSLDGSNISSGTISNSRLDATLTALAGVTTSSNTLIYATGSDTFTTTSLTSFARNILDDSDAATVRSTIGLGTAAVLNSGTSGGAVALCNGANTWSASQIMTASSSSAIPLILRGASGQSANILEIQNSSSTTLTRIDSGGNIYIATAGSTTSSPKKFGMSGLSSGEAARWIFGDDLNSIQCGNSKKLQIAGYTGIELIGAYYGYWPTFTPPSFVNDDNIAVKITMVETNKVGLVIQGVASQSVDSFQCRDSGGSPLFAVELSGACRMAELASNPANPTSGTEVKIYMKADKLVIQYNHGGTVKYRTLDLTGTDGLWAYSTSAP